MKIIENAEEDDLENLKDGELLKITSQDSELSEKAFTAFYDRYKDDFYKIVCRISPDENMAKELFAETMEQAYFKAEKFNAEENLSSQSERGKTLTWLKTIATRIFAQKFRDKEKMPKTVSLVSDNSEGEITNLIEKLSENGSVTKANMNHINREVEDKSLKLLGSKEEYISKERAILRNVLSNLSDRDRDILFAYLIEIDPRIKNQKLSRKTLEELREKYKVTSGYIRKLKERIFNKVRQECLNQITTVESKI